MKALTIITAGILVWVLAASCASTKKAPAATDEQLTPEEQANYDKHAKGRTALFR